METLSIEVKKDQIEESLDAKLEGNFFGRNIKKISSRFIEMYNNNVRYIRGAGRVALISAVAIVAYNAIDGPDKQASLTRPAYASGRQDLFPYAEYDSRWIYVARGSYVTLRHNLGGSIGNYFVDIQCLDVLEMTHEFGESRITRSERHNMGVGESVYWNNLSSSSIEVHRDSSDRYADRVRVRIWK